MNEIKTDLLKEYAKEGYNVLLSGKHGVGKTAIIKEVFGEVFGKQQENWKYYSASTMDPWVDFIGIPKNYTKDDGREVFTIIPPEDFTGEEEIQALFFDEINRADEKTLNAIMELIQFKSINGRKFPHLKCVWAAENPADDDDNDYSVMELDPAQKDRFQIQLSVPYKLNKKYFVNKFGKDFYDISSNWWENNKKYISPRKLDDMLSGYQKGFSMEDFSHYNKGIRELQFNLSSLNNLKQIQSVIDTGDNEAIRKYFTLDKIRSNEKLLKKKHSLVSKFYDLVDDEIKDYIERNIGFSKDVVLDMEVFTKSQQSFIRVNANKNKRYLDQYAQLHSYIQSFPFSLKNTPETNYIEIIDDIFGYNINPSMLKTYTIQQIVQRCDITYLKDFYMVITKMCSMCKSNKSNRLESKNAYVFMKKFYGSARFRDPANMNKDNAKKVIYKIENGYKVTDYEIKGMFNV